ncbi:MAG: hypothetical protein HRU24_17720 [Gammaproteobacteria bacterium]|nr:hypothetical protein [Gammaproteobacteria bacterium]
MAELRCADIDGKVSKEIRYVICSIDAETKIFGNAIRKHWSIDNQRHWILDVSCEKDLKAKRFKAALDTDYAENRLSSEVSTLTPIT